MPCRALSISDQSVARRCSNLHARSRLTVFSPQPTCSAISATDQPNASSRSIFFSRSIRISFVGLLRFVPGGEFGFRLLFIFQILDTEKCVSEKSVIACGYVREVIGANAFDA